MPSSQRRRHEMFTNCCIQLPISKICTKNIVLKSYLVNIRTSFSPSQLICSRYCLSSSTITPQSAQSHFGNKNKSFVLFVTFKRPLHFSCCQFKPTKHPFNRLLTFAKQQNPIHKNRLKLHERTKDRVVFLITIKDQYRYWFNKPQRTQMPHSTNICQYPTIRLQIYKRQPTDGHSSSNSQFCRACNNVSK